MQYTQHGGGFVIAFGDDFEEGPKRWSGPLVSAKRRIIVARIERKSDNCRLVRGTSLQLWKKVEEKGEFREKSGGGFIIAGLFHTLCTTLGNKHILFKVVFVYKYKREENI